MLTPDTEGQREERIKVELHTDLEKQYVYTSAFAKPWQNSNDPEGRQPRAFRDRVIRVKSNHLKTSMKVTIRDDNY